MIKIPAFSLFGMVAVAVAGCTDDFQTCSDCSGEGGEGGQAGNAGTSAQGGSSSGGSSGSGSAGSGASAGQAGSDSGGQGGVGEGGDGGAGGSDQGGAAGAGGTGECERDSGCDDGVACNGAETCIQGSCRAGQSPCDNPDEDHCAVVCSEGAGTAECLVLPRDEDGDTHGDAACSDADVLGTDCDDTDKTVFPGAEERCDGQDNDCDGRDELLQSWDTSGNTKIRTGTVEAITWVPGRERLAITSRGATERTLTLSALDGKILETLSVGSAEQSWNSAVVAAGSDIFVGWTATLASQVWTRRFLADSVDEPMMHGFSLGAYGPFLLGTGVGGTVASPSTSELTFFVDGVHTDRAPVAESYQNLKLQTPSLTWKNDVLSVLSYGATGEDQNHELVRHTPSAQPVLVGTWPLSEASVVATDGTQVAAAAPSLDGKGLELRIIDPEVAEPVCVGTSAAPHHGEMGRPIKLAFIGERLFALTRKFDLGTGAPLDEDIWLVELPGDCQFSGEEYSVKLVQDSAANGVFTFAGEGLGVAYQSGNGDEVWLRSFGYPVCE